MENRDNLKDLLLALLSSGGLVVGMLGALCVAGLAQWLPADGIPGQQEAQVWSSVAMAALALCGLPGLLAAARGILDEARLQTARPPRFWAVSLLMLPLALLFHYLAYDLNLLPGILGPAANLLTAAFSVVVSIQMVRLHTPSISLRRFWAQFLTGAYLVPVAIIVLEIAALIPVVLLLTATMFGSGLEPPSMETLIDPHFDPQQYWQQLDMNTIFNPAGITLLVMFLGVIIPLIEELMKTAAIWPVIRRISNAGEAYLAGALGGAGYGLFEALMLTQPGPDWLQVGLLRIGATFLHTATAALTSWGLYLSVQRRKLWISLACYAAAVLVHGIWNLNAIFMSWLTLGQASEPWIQTLLSLHLGQLPLGIFILLSLATFLSLPLLARKSSMDEDGLEEPPIIAPLQVSHSDTNPGGNLTGD